MAVGRQIGLRQRLRYRFDNLMARGTGAQILMLAVATGVLILITTLAVIATGLVPQDEAGHEETTARTLWRGLMHTLDAGNVGGYDGKTGWSFLLLMLFVTVGGIFVLSALIGILNGGFGQLIDNLRKGRSLVVERGHTVILGYTPKIHTLLSELAEANANQPSASVVVLADRDKVAMDEEIRGGLGKKRLRVVTRSGSPLQLADLEITNLGEAKAIVVLSPESHADGSTMAPNEADTVVLKMLLAVSKLAANHGHKLHIVAEVQDEKTLAVARMVVGEDAALILAPPLISRLLVQTGRQSGLSVVYTELLDFGGAEIYMKPEPALEGKTFREALFAYDDSALMGVLTADEQILLPPPMDRRMAKGDQVIAISEDDDTVVANGRGGPLTEGAIVAAPPLPERHRERTLVLGGSERLGLVLRELDAYVAAGSETLVLGEDPTSADRVTALSTDLRNMKAQFRAADVTDRGVLDSLAVGDFHHVLVLSETAGRTQELADARTMITLLHLRDIARRSGKTVPVTTEMLDIQNRELAAVAEADDFIISNTLVSLLVSQVSENRHLAKVFDELFSPGGYEIYLKPAGDFVTGGVDVDFYTVAEAAARRGEVALGYRLSAAARDAQAAYGVVVNPKKHARVRLGAGDKVIVLAQD